MPSRRDIFTNGYIYHIYNKTIDHRKIFNSDPVSSYFIELTRYYRSAKSNLRYSYYKELTESLKISKEKEILNPRYFKVEILCYSLMPNHFHFLIKQKKEDGVIRFMSNIINSITHYYNLKNNRRGPIFFPQFKSRVILTDEQLNHVSRYIHLNIYSSGLTKSIDELLNYKYSSFPIYIEENNANNVLINSDIILNNFDHNKSKYKKFVLDNAEHQKTLEYAKHLEKYFEAKKFIDLR